MPIYIFIQLTLYNYHSVANFDCPIAVAREAEGEDGEQRLQSDLDEGPRRRDLPQHTQRRETTTS